MDPVLTLLRKIRNSLTPKGQKRSQDDSYRALNPEQISEYKNKYDVKTDISGHRNHDTVWTAAPGVWHCRDCHEWYRTWEDHPNEIE